MGRPYGKELRALSDTYEWALNLPLGDLESAIDDFRSAPLLVVGSGGSFAAATFIANVHESCTGQLSRAATPLDASNLQSARNLHVMFLSAGGTNADVRGSLKAVMRLEPLSCLVMCFSLGSPLARKAREYATASVIELELPSGKDGFLSVNSLFAFAVLCMRAYTVDGTLPREFSELESGYVNHQSPLGMIRDQMQRLWQKKYLLLVHGSDLRPAAVDMESKFSEAALGAMQVSDLRNFAHGRHHWIAKHSDQTGVIFLTSQREIKAMQRTSRLLPESVAQAIVNIPGEGLLASLRGLLWVFHFAGFAGQALDIDPGRPGVPDFGGRIYSLNIWRSRMPEVNIKRIAVDRKLAACCLSPSSSFRCHWENGFDSFLTRLEEARFEAIVCDFDGTLVDPRQRFGAVPAPLAANLNRVLAEGIPIGIATGRGASVRDILRTAISPKLQHLVHVGYHNSSEIVRLDSELTETAGETEVRSMIPAVQALELSEIIRHLCTVHPSRHQIGLRARDGISSDVLYKVVRDELSNLIGREIDCVVSTHSVDIVPTQGTKTFLNRYLERLGFRHQLVIGDMGEWPGNDYALLAEPFSLSSARVSTSLSTCWNLAPDAKTYSSATNHYLDSIQIDGLSFRLEGLRQGVHSAD